MKRITLSWTRYHTRYRKFSLKFSRFYTICNELPRITNKSVKNIYVLYFFKENDSNTW